MRLDTIIVADAAAVAGGKLSILGAWTTRLRPPGFPWSEPFTVIVRAFVEEEDYGQAQSIEIVMQGPGVVGGIPARFELAADQLEQARTGMLEGEQHAIAVTSTQIGVQFLEPGLYELVVRFNGDEVGRYPLPVVPAEPPPVLQA